MPKTCARLVAAVLLATTALAGVGATTPPASATPLPPSASANDASSEYSFGTYSPAGGPEAGVFEVSGLAPSNQQDMDGIYWAVRDHHPTEDRRFLYRMRYDARQQAGPGGGNGLVIEAAIPIAVAHDPTDDWEAVATDRAGNVYIGDTGPGVLSAPRVTERSVHMIAADRLKNWTAGPLTPSRTWTYLPDTPSAAGLTPNVEAMFSIDDQIYLASRGANTRVAKLDMNGDALTGVPGADSLYPALSQLTGAEVSYDGHTMLALTRGNGFRLQSSYIYPRQDRAPLTADEKTVKLLAQFGIEPNSSGVSSELEYSNDLQFEGVAFGDTGASGIDGTSSDRRRQDDNAYALMVTDHAASGNNQVYRVPAQGFRDGVTCSVTFSKDGTPDSSGDRVMVSWDGFDADDAHSGSASMYVHRTVVDPSAGGSYYWQGNIGRNVHKLEQFANDASSAKEIRYLLFPRQDLPGGLSNQDMFIAVPCGAEALGETLTCSSMWNGSGGIDVAWNHPDVLDRSYEVYRTVDDKTQGPHANDLRAEHLTDTRFVDTVDESFDTLNYRVVSFSGSAEVDSADCGTLFSSAGELACSLTSDGSIDRIIWDRFKGADLAEFPNASLAKVKVFRQEVGTAAWYQQGFFGVNTDTLHEDNRSKDFTYQLEVWVDANGTQQALPVRITCD